MRENLDHVLIRYRRVLSQMEQNIKILLRINRINMSLHRLQELYIVNGINAV